MTAVEQLIRKLMDNDMINLTLEQAQENKLGELLLEAKEIEKAQILDAYSQCWIDNFMPTGNPTRPAIDYYNETFNKEQ